MKIGETDVAVAVVDKDGAPKGVGLHIRGAEAYAEEVRTVTGELQQALETTGLALKVGDKSATYKTVSIPLSRANAEVARQQPEADADPLKAMAALVRKTVDTVAEAKAGANIEADDEPEAGGKFKAYDWDGIHNPAHALHREHVLTGISFKANTATLGFTGSAKDNPNFGELLKGLQGKHGRKNVEVDAGEAQTTVTVTVPAGTNLEDAYTRATGPTPELNNVLSLFAKKKEVKQATPE